MNKAYTKTLKEKFDLAIAETWPQFQVSRLQRKAYGGRLYQCVCSNGLTGFLCLLIHDNADEFNIDIGFSRDGMCPEESFFLNPNDTFTMPGVLFRLSEFWDQKDPWWIIEEYVGYLEEKARLEKTGTTALPPEVYSQRIDVLIADAISKLHQYAVPYFARLTTFN